MSLPIAPIAGASHEHGGDDLKAVGDPVLELLQQDLLLAHEIVLDLLGEAAAVTSATASTIRMVSASK